MKEKVFTYTKYRSNNLSTLPISQLVQLIKNRFFPPEVDEIRLTAKSNVEVSKRRVAVSTAMRNAAERILRGQVTKMVIRMPEAYRSLVTEMLEDPLQPFKDVRVVLSRQVQNKSYFYITFMTLQGGEK